MTLFDFLFIPFWNEPLIISDRQFIVSESVYLKLVLSVFNKLLKVFSQDVDGLWVLSFEEVLGGLDDHGMFEAGVHRFEIKGLWRLHRLVRFYKRINYYFIENKYGLLIMTM